MNFLLHKNILIVEDENIIALSTQSKLRRSGYDVPKTASTGEQAVELALKIKPSLILMDIQLSGKIDGIEAAERILKYLDIPIIYITAYADKLTMQRAKRTLPYCYIIKPYTETELLANIELALYKHEYERKTKKK